MIRLFFKRPIQEMATVYTSEEYGVLVSVNPDSNRKGDPYFKFFNSNTYTQAKKVIRIYFKKLGYTFHRSDGKKLWKLNSKELKMLMNILCQPSKAFPQYTNWDAAKFYWNQEYFGAMFNMDDYFKGIYDTEYKDHPSYIPSKLSLPNYRNMVIK